MSITATETQVRQRLAELLRSHRYTLAREIAATIAHEINSPLGAILTNTETLQALLQSDAPDLTELRVIAADIHRDSQRAADVIRHLRNFLRKSKHELKAIDLTEPVRDAVQFYAALSAGRNAEISCSLAPGPLPVNGNVVLLHQAIMSLIVNAIDAMSELPIDRRKLEIATVRAERSAEISVADTGPGIPPDKLKEIFAPFVSSKEDGMGLGLPIVRTIIEAHDGRIRGENRSGGGAVFRISLPLLTA